LPFGWRLCGRRSNGSGDRAPRAKRRLGLSSYRRRSFRFEYPRPARCTLGRSGQQLITRLNHRQHRNRCDLVAASDCRKVVGLPISQYRHGTAPVAYSSRFTGKGLIMKLIFVALLLTLGLGADVRAQSVDTLPSITLVGTAEIKVAPDEVTFSLDVIKRDKDLPTAKQANDEVVAKVLELARRFNAEPQNVRTDNISVSRKFQMIKDPKNKIFDEDGDEIGRKIFLGYEVAKTVTIKLTDLKRFEDFFSESLKTGIAEVNSVNFTTSKLRETNDQARDLAMKAAKEKATAMAASVGQTIGKAIKIEEGTPSNHNFNLSANYSSNTTSVVSTKVVSESVATFAPGLITVEAQVTVTFLLN